MAERFGRGHRNGFGYRNRKRHQLHCRPCNAVRLNEKRPLATNGEIKKFTAKTSGRDSIVRGAKYERGFIVRPEQILALFHDTQPGLPLPIDAQFQGLGLRDEGCDSQIQFYFTSQIAPHEHCLAMKPELFFRILVGLADGLLPSDSELDGIEISPRFTVIMLRVRSSHWPPAIKEELPLYHLRYDLGRLLLVDPSKAIENEKRIRIN